jgi:hypothetical protein
MRSTFLVKKARLFAALTTLACSIDVDSQGEGKACSPDGRCSEGYHCSAERRCVASPLGHDAAADSAGAAGTEGGRGGTGDGGSSGSGSAIDGQGGTKVEAGNDANLPDAGGAGGTLGDAGPADADTPPPDTGCTGPTRYYADGDRDGFGRDDSTLWACTRPGGSWATRGGDCHDADDRVFPGQITFFETGYARANGDSFDYDCSGSEQPDPAQEGPAPNCAGLAVPDCSGSGFDSTGRSGPLIDPVCGSTSLVECTPALLVCGTRTSTTQPKRCR